MGCNSSKHKCERKNIYRNIWCDNDNECKAYRCDKGLVQSSNKGCISYWRSQTSVAKNALERAEDAETRAEDAEQAEQAAEARAEDAEQAKKAAEARAEQAREEQEEYKQILLKKTNKEAERKKKAQDAVDLARIQLDAIRFESKRLRELNACKQDDIDALKKQHLILAKERELEEARAVAQAELILAEEREAKAKEELRLKEEAMANRINFSQTAKMRVSFTPIPKQKTPTLKIEFFTNPEKLIDSADQVINNIYTNHHEHNLKTYVQNKIVIDEMTDKINNINSRLQYKMNKNINYGPDGQLNFY